MYYFFSLGNVYKGWDPSNGSLTSRVPGAGGQVDIQTKEKQGMNSGMHRNNKNGRYGGGGGHNQPERFFSLSSLTAPKNDEEAKR